MDRLDVYLTATAVLLFAIEALLVPGVGVAGLGGGACLIAAVLLAWSGRSPDAVGASAWLEPLVPILATLVVSVACLMVVLRLVPRTRGGRRLVLGSMTNREAGFVSAPSPSLQLGEEGIADTDLRPSGVARFGAHRIDVVTDGRYVTAGARVRVSELGPMRVVVEAVSDDPDHS